MLASKAIDAAESSVKSDYKPLSGCQADVVLTATPIDLVSIPSPVQPLGRLSSSMDTEFLFLQVTFENFASRFKQIFQIK